MWKEAVVIGIHKPGKPTNEPASYRPISLLSTLGKMYERVILTRLRHFTQENSLLQNEQFGFRARHNCVHQVLRITETVHRGSYRKMLTGAVFFDVEKAFDKVWHNGLIYKLYNLKVPTRLVHIIRDFLSNRGFRYRVEGTLSSRHTVTAGVPQGSALSPLLFSLYTSDLPITRDAHLALYADDTALYTSARSPVKIVRTLQTAVDKLGRWFRKWRIEVNPTKSAAIMFHRPRLNFGPLPPPVRLFNTPIPWTPQVKYLGVILDQKLTFIPHVNAVRARAAFALGQLYALLNGKSKLSTRNKIRVYIACIRPIMTYAAPVFAHIPQYRLHRMQTLQSRFLRKALGSPWYVRNVDLHVAANVPSIRQHMKGLSRQYFDRATNHSNPLIRQSSVYTPFDRAKWRRPRSVLNDPDDEITLAINLAEEHRRSMTLHNRPSYRPRRRGPRRASRNPTSLAGPRAEDDD